MLPVPHVPLLTLGSCEVMTSAFISASIWGGSSAFFFFSEYLKVYQPWLCIFYFILALLLFARPGYEKGRGIWGAYMAWPVGGYPCMIGVTVLKA